MSRRIIIIGGPHVGKSTLSEKLRDELGIETLRCSHDLEDLFPASRKESWSEQSDHASKWFDESGDWIIEGVQMARALRKWLKANPGVPLDADIVTLSKPFDNLIKGQQSMTAGVHTVFREIESELVRRGARVHKLKSPDDAIGIFSSDSPLRDAGETQKVRRPMALKKGFTKAEWEAIPEAARKFYEQEKIYVPDGENWKLDGLDEADGVTKALQKERDNVAAAKKALTDLQAKYGDLDPEKAREALQRLEEAEQEEAKKSGNFQAILDAANKKFDAERAQLKQLLQEKDDLLATKETTIQDIVLDQGLTAAIAKHKGDPLILLPIIKSKKEVKAVLDGDAYLPRVFDKDGNQVIGDTKGNPMDLDQYVDLLKQHPSYAKGFEPTGNGGMGAHGGNGGGAGGNVIRLSREQVKQNSAVYAQAKEQAARSGATIEFTD